MKRLGAKSQQKTMRGRGTDGLQRCSGSDHEPYAQTDHNYEAKREPNEPSARRKIEASKAPARDNRNRSFECLNEKEEKQESKKPKAKSAMARARELVR